MEGGRYIESEVAQQLAQNTSVVRGLMDLTVQDMEIMQRLAEGMSLAEVADTLGIDGKAAANACSSIRSLLGVTRTNDLVRLAMTLFTGR